MRERLTVLDELYVDISTTARARSLREPALEINDGYTKLLFACGYHRLDSATRAMELEAAGRELLEAHREDPVHAWLIDVLEARGREAASTRTTGELPAPLLARLDAFDRVTRYKVDRFREASWIVGGGMVDAIRHFQGRGPDDIAATTASFLEMVDRAFALAETADEVDAADAYIEASLHVSPETIEREVAASVLDRVLPRIERMADRRGLAYARAVAIAAHAAPARVPALIEQVVPSLAHAPWDLDEMLALLSTSLAPNHQTELAELWKRVPESVHATTAYLLGLLRLGATPDKHDLFRACARGDASAHVLRVAMLDAFLARPFSERFAEPWAGELFASTTDDLSTNSHFTYSVIHLIDRLVRGVLDP